MWKPQWVYTRIITPLCCCRCLSGLQQEDWRSLAATLDCVAGVQLPLALVSSVSVLLLLLHVSLWARHVYMPIQLPVYAIAWARAVISVQLLKVRIRISIYRVGWGHMITYL